MKRFSGLVLILLFAAAAMAADDPYRALARKLSAPAGKRLKKVAILPFGCAESTGTSKEGNVLTARLTTELVNLHKFTIIDRGQFYKILEVLSFRPEAGASPDIIRTLEKKLGIDAIIAGMSSDLGDGSVELNAWLIKAEDGSAAAAGRAVISRDWAPESAEPPAEGPPALRATLRALAKQNGRAAGTPEWAEFLKIKAASLATRLSITALGGSEKIADAEIDAWKISPSEQVSSVYYLCSAASCDKMGIKGEGYFKAYYSDGFVVQIDETGDVLDCYYPEKSIARAKMRQLAKTRQGQNMAVSPEWSKFQQVMDFKYFPVPDKRDPDSLRSEIDRWKTGTDEEVTGDYSRETEDAADFYGVVFSDGFSLVFDGPTGAITSCQYEVPEKAE